MTDKDRFHFAVAFSDLETVKELHTIVDLDAPTADGRTPLTTAIGGGVSATMINKKGEPSEMVRLLIELGANPGKKDAHGWSPWMVCCSRLSDRVVEDEQRQIRSILEAAHADRSGEELLRLSEAARQGDGDTVLALLDAGADINSPIAAPLLAAIHGGHTPLLKLLLDRGANPDCLDSDDPASAMTPLIHAASQGRFDIARLLAEHGADILYAVGGGDDWELTAEGHAREAGHLALADWLRANAPAEAIAARQAKIAARNPKFQKLYAARTSAPNYNLNTDAIVARLELWDQRHGIKKIKNVDSSALTLVFERTPDPLETFVDEVYQFCPDIVDQGLETVQNLAKDIAKRNTLILWWD